MQIEPRVARQPSQDGRMSLLCQRTERQKADHVANTHATHWMEKHPVEADGRTWASVTEEYLKAMSATNRRETSLADKRLKLAILGAAFSETAMKAIDKADIEAKIEELATDRGWSEGSKQISGTVNLCLDSDFDFDWPDAIIIRIAEAIHILLHFHHESAHSERFQRAGARAA